MSSQMPRLQLTRNNPLKMTSFVEGLGLKLIHNLFVNGPYLSPWDARHLVLSCGALFRQTTEQERESSWLLDFHSLSLERGTQDESAKRQRGLREMRLKIREAKSCAESAGRPFLQKRGCIIHAHTLARLVALEFTVEKRNVLSNVMGALPVTSGGQSMLGVAFTKM